VLLDLIQVHLVGMHTILIAYFDQSIIIILNTFLNMVSTLCTNTPVSRCFSTTVQFDKQIISTGLILIQSAYKCAFYRETIAFFHARI